MPLNEEEQRILAEIERQLHASDPESAKRIESTTLPGYLARNCRWAALGLLLGLIVLLVAFASNWAVGVLGFVVMVASAVVLVQNLRKISRLRLEEVARSVGARNLGEAIEDLSRRFRRRISGDDEL